MSANPYAKEWDFSGQGGKKYRSVYENTHPNDLYKGGWGIEEWNPQLGGGKGEWSRRGGEAFLKNPDQSTGFLNTPEEYWGAVGGGNPLEFQSQDQIESWLRKAGSFTSNRLKEKQMKTAAGDAGPGREQEDPFLARLRQQNYALQHDRPWNPSDNQANLHPDAGESYPDFLKRRAAWEQSPEGKERLSHANDWTESGAYEQAGGQWQSRAAMENGRKMKAYQDWKTANPGGKSADFEAAYQPGWTQGSREANWDTTKNPYLKAALQAQAQQPGAPATTTSIPAGAAPPGGQQDFWGGLQGFLSQYFPQFAQQGGAQQPTGAQQPGAPPTDTISALNYTLPPPRASSMESNKNPYTTDPFDPNNPNAYRNQVWTGLERGQEYDVNDLYKYMPQFQPGWNTLDTAVNNTLLNSTPLSGVAQQENEAALRSIDQLGQAKPVSVSANDPGVKAAMDVFKQAVQPQIDSQYSLMGLGRSQNKAGALDRAMVEALAPQLSEQRQFNEQGAQRQQQQSQFLSSLLSGIGQQRRAGKESEINLLAGQGNKQREFEGNMANAAERERLRLQDMALGSMSASAIPTGSSSAKQK